MEIIIMTLYAIGIFSTLTLVISGIIYVTAKLHEKEETVKPSIYYKGFTVQYFWKDVRGCTVLETGVVDKVTKDYLVVVRDNRHHRIVYKVDIFENVPEDIHSINI